MNKTKPRQVIFDTDPGVDDAMALYFALAHPGIEVVGITTTFGNVTVKQAAINALYLCEIAGKQVPVTRGVATPWRKPAGARLCPRVGNRGGACCCPHSIPTSLSIHHRGRHVTGRSGGACCH